MDFTRLATISHKEISDHITSRKFLLILVITCLVLGVAAANGVSNYNNALESYKNGNVGYLFLPSILLVFNQITNSVGIDGLGAIIGIAIGFDLISGERDERSLKTILSQPLFRDELINGKAIGGIITLSVITLAGFLTVIAVLAVIGIVPSLEEIFFVGIIWLITMLFMTYAFSLSLMSSVIAKTSSGALILSIIFLFMLMYIIPIGGGELTSYLLLGPKPSENMYDFGSGYQADAFEIYQVEYYQNKDDLQNFFNLFSIRSVYDEITGTITMPSHYVINEKIGFVEYSHNPEIGEDIEKPTIFDIMADKWMKIIVFIMWPVLFFGIAYVKFMRMDLR